MELFIAFASFVFGSIWGSFFYTLALRTIDGSLMTTPWKALFTSSKCPACGASIKPQDLIPIVSYALLKRKCRSCGGDIAPAYPIFEALYGFLMVLIVREYDVTLYAASIFLLAGVALTIAIIDAKTMQIPNFLVIAFVILSVYPISVNDTFRDNIYGLAVMGGIFLMVLLIFPGAFGGGDIKFAAAIGLVCGLEFSIVALETALVTGALVGVGYALATRKGLKIKVPFAPFLTAGLIVALLYGRDIVLLYYRSF